MRNSARFWGIAAVCLNIAALSGGYLRSEAAPKENHLIVPGKSIGNARLTHRGNAVLKKLGKADVSDGAMQQSRQIWISKGAPRQTLFVHTFNNSVSDIKPMSDLTIDQIRVTSPAFHTQNGVSTASALAQIRSKYPHLKLKSDPDTHYQTVIYADAHLGIAFEFQKDAPRERPLGITVYSPGSDHALIRQSDVEETIKSNMPDKGK